MTVLYNQPIKPGTATLEKKKYIRIIPLGFFMILLQIIDMVLEILLALMKLISSPYIELQDIVMKWFQTVKKVVSLVIH